MTVLDLPEWRSHMAPKPAADADHARRSRTPTLGGERPGYRVTVTVAERWCTPSALVATANSVWLPGGK